MHRTDTPVVFGHAKGMSIENRADLFSDPMDTTIDLHIFATEVAECNPEYLLGLSEETRIIAYQALYDALVLDDSALIQYARKLDEYILQDDTLAQLERAHMGALLPMQRKRHKIYASSPGISPEQAVANSMWMLREDVAVRVLRLTYLSRRPKENLIQDQYSPELTRATKLAQFGMATTRERLTMRA